MSTIPVRNTTPTRPYTSSGKNLSDIIRRVRALRALSLATGFSTNRSVGEMLDPLSQEELVHVGESFLLTPIKTGSE